MYMGGEALETRSVEHSFEKAACKGNRGMGRHHGIKKGFIFVHRRYQSAFEWLNGTDLRRREKLNQVNKASGVKSENRKSGIQFPKSWPTSKKWILKIKFTILILWEHVYYPMGVILQRRQLAFSIIFYTTKIISHPDSVILSVLFFFSRYIIIRLRY